MFSLKTILFAATAVLAGIASALPDAQDAPIAVEAPGAIDARSIHPVLVARGTPSIPTICTDVLVKLDDILVDVRKSPFLDLGEFVTD